MDKREQQIFVVTKIADGDNDDGVVHSPKKRNFLRLTWVATLCSCIAIWMTLAAFSNRATWIDMDGVLHEPLFGLVPISLFLLLASVVLASIDMTRRFRKPRSASSEPISSRV